jgi:hypothetical protein
MRTTRRGFLKGAAATAMALGGLGSLTRPVSAADFKRRFHLSISEDAIDNNPGILDQVKSCGVTDVWITGYLYGRWDYTIERIVECSKRVEKAGLAVHLINIPLGHPGNSLGQSSSLTSTEPPRRWKNAVNLDGDEYVGTSLHPPALDDNVDAVRKLVGIGVKGLFVDDDFRLARSPGEIGGCFCDDHKKEFLQTRGYDEARWTDLLESARSRSLTPVLNEWIEYTCDQLTGLFRAMKSAGPDIDLGIMVMYMGAEKAGIRLKDYAGVPFRVGEMMFSDASFAPLKAKTNELFSALFHRRFTTPELAYSETTAFPSDQLSAANMAAKLVTSTIADVRNTMFMSGIEAFPRAHWDVLAPAMKHNTELHAQVAGHAPKGPFKHFWGEHARKTSNDDSNSLFLASGVPFEVIDAPPTDGFAFLCDADARAAASGAVRLDPAKCVIRAEAGLAWEGAKTIPDSLEAVFALKRELLPKLGDIPYVQEDQPIVCAWYPTAERVLLWNLAEKPAAVTLRKKDVAQEIKIGPLGVEIARI